MLRWMLGLVLISQILLAGCCTPKRWSANDPRDTTPLPTPTVIATVVVNLGQEAGNNTPAANTQGK